jgi:hypothetical protein
LEAIIYGPKRRIKRYKLLPHKEVCFIKEAHSEESRVKTRHTPQKKPLSKPVEPRSIQKENSEPDTNMGTSPLNREKKHIAHTESQT